MDANKRQKSGVVLRAGRSPKLVPKLEAFAFQLAAVRALEDKPYAAVFHEQGLGKTKIAIDLALNWLSRSVVDSVLIVTKRSLLRNWQDELARHTYLAPRLLSQDRLANYHALNSPARCYLTHYEVVRSEEKRFALFLKTRRIGIVLDEAHKIKNPETAISTALIRLSPLFTRRVILTGTPVANRPYDIWAPIFFLDGGRSLGANYDDFKARLDLSNDLGRDKSRQVAFESELGNVFSKIAEFTVRETKKTAGITLPDKVIENIPCELEHRQRELYDNYTRELKSIVLRDGLPVLDDADDILKRLLRLVQVAADPGMVDQSYRREPGKLPILRQLLFRVSDFKEKAIVWTTFIHTSLWLQKELAEFNPVVVNGNVDLDSRTRRLCAFRDDPDVRVLIATPGAAKEGLTLTVANHAIFYDRSFSLDDYLQAQDRIHRISQTRSCFVYNLIAVDTVDEWVDSLIAAKGASAELVQGDIGADEFRAKMRYGFGDAVRRILGVHNRDEED